MTRKIWTPFTLLGLIVALGLCQVAFQKSAAAQAGPAGVPAFQVDPSWPMLPDTWSLGVVPGLVVDENDHIWFLNRPSSVAPQLRYLERKPPEAECCVPAPPVMEFDAAGRFISSWGGLGSGYEWPEAEHGLFRDYKGNVWLAGNGKTDNHILKFTSTGKFLLQIGKKGQSKGSNDTANLGQPADFIVYPKTNELFIADGYGNRRIIVFDADTGAYKRHWGAYGNKPDDAAPLIVNGKSTGVPDGQGPQQFSLTHGVRVSNDGIVYVGDRMSNRIQTFTLDGKFIKEVFIRRPTRASGAVWSLALSLDPQQRFLFASDGSNNKINILNRASLELLSSFGGSGHLPGQFIGAHSMGFDSKGSLYVSEVTIGHRVQKFTLKGMSK